MRIHSPIHGYGEIVSITRVGTTERNPWRFSVRYVFDRYAGKGGSVPKSHFVVRLPDRYAPVNYHPVDAIDELQALTIFCKYLNVTLVGGGEQDVTNITE